MNHTELLRDLADCLEDMTKHYVEVRNDLYGFEAGEEIEVVAAGKLIAEARRLPPNDVAEPVASRRWDKTYPGGQWLYFPPDQDGEKLVTLAQLAEVAAERDDAIAKWEQADGMDGAVVHAIRELLNAHNVPLSAFIDDHVANAIRQRNTAEAELKAAREALERIAAMEGTAGTEAGLPYSMTTNGQKRDGVSRVGAFASDIARAALSNRGEHHD